MTVLHSCLFSYLFFLQCYRYFCELLLDNSLFARTSSKQKSEMCFWGEQFEFGNLPSLETITIVLYREADKKRKKVTRTSILWNIFLILKYTVMTNFWLFVMHIFCFVLIMILKISITSHQQFYSYLLLFLQSNYIAGEECVGWVCQHTCGQRLEPESHWKVVPSTKWEQSTE